MMTKRAKGVNAEFTRSHLMQPAILSDQLSCPERPTMPDSDVPGCSSSGIRTSVPNGAAPDDNDFEHPMSIDDVRLGQPSPPPCMGSELPHGTQLDNEFVD